jgi:hypothetical protein
VNAEELLDAARRSGLTVLVEDGDLVVRGSGLRPADLIDSLFDRAAELTELLSCSVCGATGSGLVDAYWGSTYCPPCRARVVAECEIFGWPPVKWESHGPL